MRYALSETEMDLKALGCVLLLPIQIVYYIVKASVCCFLPSRRRDLTGDVVLITGGGRGIGRHLAKEFAKRGAKKVLTYCFTAAFLRILQCNVFAYHFL